MSAWNVIRALEIGQAAAVNTALCCTMLTESLNIAESAGAGRQFAVRYVTTNWEASEGYQEVRRVA